MKLTIFYISLQKFDIMESYYSRHREEIIARVSKHQVGYRQTPMGRASRLIGNYNQFDKEAKREKGDLTAEWVCDNILFKPCAHCGKEGWQIIGCNRIDNSKPHTMDNVEPCCLECNRKLYYEEHKKKVGVYSLDGELIREFDTVTSCAKELGIGYGVVSSCCNNKYLREGNNVYKEYIIKRIC